MRESTEMSQMLPAHMGITSLVHTKEVPVLQLEDLYWHIMIPSSRFCCISCVFELSCFYSKISVFNWSVTDLQFIYIYIYIYIYMFSSIVVYHNIEYTFLCYTVDLSSIHSIYRFVSTLTKSRWQKIAIFKNLLQST